MKTVQVGRLSYECKLCGEEFLVDYSIRTSKKNVEVRPDLADLFLHMWTHEQRREAEFE